MNIIKNIINPRRGMIALTSREFLNWMNDEKYLKIRYYLIMRKKMDFNNPRTFNEKLQWLKMYNRNQEYTKMVDKYEVKKYIENTIGKEYIIPTLGVYNKFDDINFEKLPNQFVIKCTHNSGGAILVKDKEKLNIKESKKKINKLLKKNYFYNGREWPYKNVKPRIIIEKYMEDKNDTSMHDYKIHVFNGQPKFILVCSERDTNLKETFFDIKWEIEPFKRPDHDIDKKIKKPVNLEKMLELAKILSKDIPFLRVDFYEINGKIYFGEMTFYPASGFGKFEPEEWDKKIGDMLELPKEKIVEK